MPYTSNVSWIDVAMFPQIDKNVYIAVESPFACKTHGSKTVLIAVVSEPDVISLNRNNFIKNCKNYDMLLTHDEEILKACPNARLCVFGTTWIPKSIYESIDITRKQPKISSLTGSKEFTPAHTYRKLLYTNQLNIPLPITWFRSSRDTLLPAYQHNPTVYDDKSVLFLDYQFSLAIENSRQTHYFSEKLIDCLITKTIPIYYGCPNIAEYFDIRGWIILETTDIRDLVDKLQDSLPNYNEYMDTIEHNYQEAMKYKDYTENIQRAMNFGA